MSIVLNPLSKIVHNSPLATIYFSLDPGNSKAIEGIQNVEKRNGSVDLDSDDDALDGNNPEVISLEEVCKAVHPRTMMSLMLMLIWL